MLNRSLLFVTAALATVLVASGAVTAADTPNGAAGAGPGAGPAGGAGAGPAAGPGAGPAGGAGAGPAAGPGAGPAGGPGAGPAAGPGAGAAGAGPAAGPAAGPTAAPAAEPAKLTGLAAWTTLLGNTVQGKVDGKDYFEFYTQDGTVKALTGGTDLETGKWSLEGNKVCIVFSDEPKDCYQIEAIGDIVNFTDDKGKGVRWKLLKGNPKSL